jgi:hypothetical protein
MIKFDAYGIFPHSSEENLMFFFGLGLGSQQLTND